MQHFAVLGNPIQHSKSPLIHRLFAEQTGVKLLYTAINVAPQQFETMVVNFTGGGLNITQPFKQQAYHLVHALSPRAQAAQAVNTIKFNNDGTRFGDNTDGIGLVKDLTVNKKIQLTGKRILIIGAGGAARGIVAPLLNEHPASLMIANHNHLKAMALVSTFTNAILQACPFAELRHHHFDIIINAANLVTVPSIGLGGNVYCYDLAYGQGETPFISWAKTNQVSYCDGLGMLIEQAAEAFFVWHKIYPDTRLVFHKMLYT
jgi:shikimate dehydrogenase